MAPLENKDPTIAEQFLAFDDRSPSPYHATASVATLLQDSNFQRIREADDWSEILEPGGRYFFTREGSSVVAFVLDDYFGEPNLSFALIGAHTDSPCFKIKPVSKATAQGYVQVGVECYGGGLWHTWFDRDLSVAGRVAVRKKGGEGLEMKLVRVKSPILRIPNLAIHLQRSMPSEGFKVNKQTHTTPIMATELADALNKPKPTACTKSGSAVSRHPSLLLQILARELDIEPSEIEDLDLCVTDTQPAAIGGGLDEFVFGPRLDNLASCFTAIKALTNSLGDKSGAQNGELGSVVKMVTLFDHEEVGSSSSHGAGSPLTEDAIRRITALSRDSCYHRVIRNSMLVSADMAHALHPNYSSAHESKHRPLMGAGLVLKTNQNQRYATSGITGLIMREVARRAGNLPIQEFVVPNDKPCGSTIGPIISSLTGLRAVDVGQAQLSMHSVREMCSASDFESAEMMFRAFFTHFRAIDAELSETAE